MVVVVLAASAESTHALAVATSEESSAVSTPNISFTADADIAPSYIFFMKAPTAGPCENVTWLQQQPDGFSASSFSALMGSIGAPTTNPKMQVGLTFQWELLDCFVFPHSCTMDQITSGVTNFLNAAASTNVPVQVTLDPVQFYYQTNLWNWWDESQPGYDPANVANVEWTGWSPDNATLISWRNWGSQFRMPTPQPNLASPSLLTQTAAALYSAVGAIRAWYDAQPAATQQLLIGIKIGEEVDVGANYFYYPDGNDIYRRNPTDPSHDPTTGPDWSKGLSGGLPPLGYNLVRTLGLRTSGGPPTREELTKGVKHYFTNAIAACLDAWPSLSQNGLLGTHAGASGDPLLMKWESAMVPPATPGYSFYLSPSTFKSWTQPGLKTALDGCVRLPSHDVVLVVCRTVMTSLLLTAWRSL